MWEHGTLKGEDGRRKPAMSLLDRIRQMHEGSRRTSQSRRQWDCAPSEDLGAGEAHFLCHCLLVALQTRHSPVSLSDHIPLPLAFKETPISSKHNLSLDL